MSFKDENGFESKNKWTSMKIHVIIRIDFLKKITSFTCAELVSVISYIGCWDGRISWKLSATLVFG